ncbi:MAG: sigma-70 family RNA polymerase sigma factor [Bacteroidetes bacterium]|nr:MAG: sigma-70 family RNA polymerase sigma factor [Bacteroidota bacterium]REK35052.1 MAG: sigma-70 family RNA polymerase sigma factor [Bacteroidota bacterium]REK48371.1 MAG: sigma-70 family RNA polymerase sigma factor [Bacteroidota bacterium]
MHLAYGVSLKYLKDPEESRDAVMNVFEKLHQDLLKHEIHNFKSWLHTVIRNHCLMVIRRNKGKYSVPLQETIAHQQNVESAFPLHPDGVPDKEYLLQLLESGVNSLNDKQRLCIQMFYLQEKSYKEIADDTGLSMMDVKSNIQNGKRNLKIYLDKKNER